MEWAPRLRSLLTHPFRRLAPRMPMLLILR